MTAEAEPRPQDVVASFVTSRGSVYTYDENGQTTRFKAAANELQPTQDLTVFVDVERGDFLNVAKGYLAFKAGRKSELQVIEQDEDDSMRVVERIDQVQEPERLILGLFSNGELIRSKPVSIFPKLGSHVYDSRVYEENGVKRTERHFGHKVIKINPRT